MEEKMVRTKVKFDVLCMPHLLDSPRTEGNAVMSFQVANTAQMKSSLNLKYLSELGSSSVGKMLALQAQESEFNPHHHIKDQVWWYTVVDTVVIPVSQ